VSEGRYRWFSYGVAHTPGLLFEPRMLRASSDVSLYALDRQALFAQTPGLDGLEAAFDLDRTGFAPPGATFAVDEAVPSRFRDQALRLRWANVRWIFSFRPLPEDLVRQRGSVKLPEVQAPLVLYELRSPLPRAFWMPDVALAGPMGALPADPPAGATEVRYERLGAHRVRVTAATPPGLLIILDGHHPGWTAEDRSGPVELHRVLGRYQALKTPGGSRVYTLTYRPEWASWAAVLFALGLLGLALLFRW
jgi:hypothetical protein